MSKQTKFALLASSEFTSLVGKIGTAQSELTSNIQLAAINAIGYANVHGDVRPGNQLMDAMGKSMRKDSLLKYLEVHGNFAFMKADKRLAFFKNPEAVDFDNAEAVAKLSTTPWNEAKKPQDLKSQYDVDDMFTKFLASTRATIKKAQDANIRVKNIDLLDALSSTATHFEEQREEMATRVRKLSPAVIARVELEQDWDEAIVINAKLIDDKAAIDRERINNGIEVPPLRVAA